ncbi:uncharacterized protein MONOS_3658 [Monocercomonoides exilis]|uniref:uncharacterized protein n=1 Tax=Monocercomonoides exilis TaxID=2049356 RepID=UPI0035599385|nr:hypothetical protein MONOS_3658 [Monocercomonoides exilis]|eukprot:MONOS_3658.1-p1 / transcript=MONOS_3658.1 / gene=MONOS_3658 / organism=Monocercomonoides_exilis_PA203 / gene_product=unspecified product / transcript_product=unspecified product / location=Mono_scaffold00088:54658-58784(+) / protein_length=1175 / sequence_SO=supercontig / SO=protein_coding / is_pseudo=false
MTECLNPEFFFLPQVRQEGADQELIPFLQKCETYDFTSFIPHRPIYPGGIDKKGRQIYIILSHAMNSSTDRQYLLHYFVLLLTEMSTKTIAVILTQFYQDESFHFSVTEFHSIYKQLPKSFRDRIETIYVVGEAYAPKQRSGFTNLLLSSDFKSKIHSIAYCDDLDAFMDPREARLPSLVFRVDKGEKTARHTQSAPLSALPQPEDPSSFSTLPIISLPLLYPLEVNSAHIPPTEYVPYCLISLVSAFYRTSYEYNPQFFLEAPCFPSIMSSLDLFSKTVHLVLSDPLHFLPSGLPTQLLVYVLCSVLQTFNPSLIPLHTAVALVVAVACGRRKEMKRIDKEHREKLVKEERERRRLIERKEMEMKLREIKEKEKEEKRREKEERKKKEGKEGKEGKEKKDRSVSQQGRNISTEEATSTSTSTSKSKSEEKEEKNEKKKEEKTDKSDQDEASEKKDDSKTRSVSPMTGEEKEKEKEKDKDKEKDKEKKEEAKKKRAEAERLHRRAAKEMRALRSSEGDREEGRRREDDKTIEVAPRELTAEEVEEKKLVDLLWLLGDDEEEELETETQQMYEEKEIETNLKHSVFKPMLMHYVSSLAKATLTLPSTHLPSMQLLAMMFWEVWGSEEQMKGRAWNNREKRRMMIEEHRREILMREEEEKAKNAEKTLSTNSPNPANASNSATDASQKSADGKSSPQDAKTDASSPSASQPATPSVANLPPVQPRQPPSFKVKVPATSAEFNLSTFKEIFSTLHELASVMKQYLMPSVEEVAQEMVKWIGEKFEVTKKLNKFRKEQTEKEKAELEAELKKLNEIEKTGEKTNEKSKQKSELRRRIEEKERILEKENEKSKVFERNPTLPAFVSSPPSYASSASPASSSSPSPSTTTSSSAASDSKFPSYQHLHQFVVKAIDFAVSMYFSSWLDLRGEVARQTNRNVKYHMQFPCLIPMRVIPAIQAALIEQYRFRRPANDDPMSLPPIPPVLANPQNFNTLFLAFRNHDTFMFQAQLNTPQAPPPSSLLHRHHRRRGGREGGGGGEEEGGRLVLPFGANVSSISPYLMFLEVHRTHFVELLEKREKAKAEKAEEEKKRREERRAKREGIAGKSPDDGKEKEGKEKVDEKEVKDEKDREEEKAKEGNEEKKEKENEEKEKEKEEKEKEEEENASESTDDSSKSPESKE